MEGQSNRLEQTEDRISELEDELVIKRKTKELLVKQLKTCEKQIQELTEMSHKYLTSFLEKKLLNN
jgi:septal ring factor EnvC (AmiA/AmiB activator)